MECPGDTFPNRYRNTGQQDAEETGWARDSTLTR